MSGRKSSLESSASVIFASTILYHHMSPEVRHEHAHYTAPDVVMNDVLINQVYTLNRLKSSMMAFSKGRQYAAYGYHALFY